LSDLSLNNLVWFPVSFPGWAELASGLAHPGNELHKRTKPVSIQWVEGVLLASIY